jgi:phytoene desaturase
MQHKVNIIGAGIAGLAAACWLSAANCNVRLFEKQPHAGGKSHLVKTGDFWSGVTFPEITASALLDQLFQLSGRYLRDQIELTPLDPYLMIVGEDGRRFSLSSNELINHEQINKTNAADLKNYLRMSDYINKFIQHLPLQNHQRSNSFSAPLIPFLAVNGLQKNLQFTSRFLEDEFLQRVFALPPITTGCDPLTTASLALLYHKSDRQWGAHYPTGGATKIISLLQSMAVDMGCHIHFNSEVDQILTQSRRAYGLRLTDGSIHHADYLLSDAGTLNTYTNLLSSQPTGHLSRYFIHKAKPTASRFSLHIFTHTALKSNGLLPNNLILTGELGECLNDIYTKNEVGDNLILQICLPGLIDPTLRIDGGDFLSIHAWMPNLSAQIRWNTAASALRSAILNWLEDRLLPGLRANIKKEFLITPEVLAEGINRPLGSAYDPKCSLSHLAGIPPANIRSPFPNLFLIGEGAHYLPGLSGALTSADLAARSITQS